MYAIARSDLYLGVVVAAYCQVESHVWEIDVADWWASVTWWQVCRTRGLFCLSRVEEAVLGHEFN